MNADKCIVTGGAGFIGSHVADLLLDSGYQVEIIDDLSTGCKGNLNPKAVLHEVDIRDLEALRPIFRGTRWVFHAAAWPRIQLSFDDPLTHEDINVGGTINCLMAAREAGVQRFLYFGSSAVYGTPDEIPTTETAAIRCYNPYALQKYTAEQYCVIMGNHWGMPVVSLRIFNVYGPRSYNQGQPNSAYSPVIGIFHHLRKNGQPLTITGSGEQSRDFVHVFDVAQAFLQTARSSVSGEIFNIGSGTSESIDTIAARMSSHRTRIPERPNEARVSHASIAKIQAMIGWQPRLSLDEGLDMLE
jgi:UDP-glucose 4-epimerase